MPGTWSGPRMSGDEPTAANLAAFLRDVMEASTKQQSTVALQTRDGFSAWLETITLVEGIKSPYLARPEKAPTVVLEVTRPGPEPRPPREITGAAWELLTEQQQEAQLGAIAGHRREQSAWQTHKDLYDNLFGARTPSENMELVFATGLLATRSDREEFRRHLVTAPAEVELDRASQALRVAIVDSPRIEINWTDAQTRTTLGDAAEALRDLQDGQSYEDTIRATKSVRASFGLSGVDIPTPTSPLDADCVGLDAHPALLLRKRDSSAMLQLLRDMAADMADGGHVSEPFKMIVSPTHRPEEKDVELTRAALPLPANEEQRMMLDNARQKAHLVLQGPPGTGKTHTIANLAAVLMAEGRRVLITAENERALGEVQSKLPEDMRPLMLPMLKERGTGPLQASVNALSARSTGTSSQDTRQRQERDALAKIDKLELSITSAERRLRDIAHEDRRSRTFETLDLPVSGHQMHLAARHEQMVLVDSYISETGSVSPADAVDLDALSGVVTDHHRDLARHRFPEGLMAAGELALWLQDHRSQLSILGDPGDFDHTELSGIVDDLVRLAAMLQDLPPTPWNSITRTSEDYLQASLDATAVAADIDHGITLDPPHARTEAIALCEEYLALDDRRFNESVAQLVERQAQALEHAGSSEVLGEFDRFDRALELTRACEEAVEALRRDQSGLLSLHVADHRRQGHSGADTLFEEARGLIDGSRDTVGLDVTVSDGAPALHELAKQAETLRDHFADGGKMTGLIRRPAAVRQAEELIRHVQVGGSEVDTEEEAARAAEYLRFRNQILLVDSWAKKHALTRPAQTPHHEWLTAVVGVPALSKLVCTACNLADELVTFRFGSAPEQPESLLIAARATVSKELAETLAGLAGAAKLAPTISIAGLPIRDQMEAARVLAAIRSVSIRSARHEMLPESWSNRCNPVDVDDVDRLFEMLRVCAAAAAVPGQARTADLVPSAVNRIAERAQIDRRRSDLKDEHDRVIGGLRRTLTACVPQSPATQALSRALEDEDPIAYRQGLEALESEVKVADRAVRLDAVRTTVERAHPQLLSAFDTGERKAAQVLGDIATFERLREHRKAVRAWKEEIGTAEEVHEQLRRLHNDTRRAEHQLASLRCWGKAIDRLQERRELQSSLSALSSAMDAVPKTRTAKRYPARMRALRKATTAAAPAIPCWVMTIDRVAEVLGYPTGEDRFDVVIVDEASQAWFPAMFLYAIADQVVIVGDKQQTSPSQMVNVDQLSSIAREHISGHRLEDRVGDDLSLYDVAEVMTGPDMMVDHFRCVPEIIDISNRLSYAPMGRSLQASRVREPGALTPVNHVQVPSTRTGHGANLEEVEAIVQQVLACHTDPAYKDKEFGVVVVGPNFSAHLKALRTRMIEELGPQAMGDRNLEVGTASQFQGAERDVMFLSLVVASELGQRIRIWPHEHQGRNRRNVQSLNVAASRARDQLWIFHSFAPTDLQPNDARLILLKTPPVETPQLSAQLASCDSDFERDVVNALAEADPGLTIMTQVEALGYKIDIVVHDRSGNRLAVECDGDRWHSSDTQIRNDLYRQRTLETIGWRFYRFLASEWYDAPAKHLSAIIAELTRVDSTLPQPLAVTDGFSSPESSFSAPEPLSESISAESRESEDETSDELTGQPVASTPLEAQAAEAHRRAHSLRPEAVPAPPAKRDLEPDSAISETAERHGAPESPASYDSWHGHISRVPGLQNMNVKRLAEILISATKDAGPLQVDHLYQVVNKAAGNLRVGPKIRKNLDKALTTALTSGELVVEQAESADANGVIRAAGRPAVSLRVPGERSLYEYPEYELAALIRHLHQRDPVGLRTQDKLFRAVIAEFGSSNLTEKAKTLLECCRSADGLPVVNQLLSSSDQRVVFDSSGGDWIGVRGQSHSQDAVDYLAF